MDESGLTPYVRLSDQVRLALLERLPKSTAEEINITTSRIMKRVFNAGRLDDINAVAGELRGIDAAK